MNSVSNILMYLCIISKFMYLYVYNFCEDMIVENVKLQKKLKVDTNLPLAMLFN